MIYILKVFLDFKCQIQNVKSLKGIIPVFISRETEGTKNHFSGTLQRTEMTGQTTRLKI